MTQTFCAKKIFISSRIFLPLLPSPTGAFCHFRRSMEIQFKSNRSCLHWILGERGPLGAKGVTQHPLREHRPSRSSRQDAQRVRSEVLVERRCIRHCLLKLDVFAGPVEFCHRDSSTVPDGTRDSQCSLMECELFCFASVFGSFC